jgi:hypothetical protein
LAGVSLTHVSKLLGHSSEAITEKYYSAWIKGRQEVLEAAVKQTFVSEFAAPTDTKPIQSNSIRVKNLQKSDKNAQK